MEKEIQFNQPFTELEVWKKARELKSDFYNLVKIFPPEEKYRLADQLIRASRSVTANISEGHGRFSYKEQLHFCMQARGSLSECLNHIFDALDCQFIDNEKFQQIKMKIEQVSRLLNGYITYLRRQVKAN